jgi:hypothetical protein
VCKSLFLRTVFCTRAMVRNAYGVLHPMLAICQRQKPKLMRIGLHDKAANPTYAF